MRQGLKCTLVTLALIPALAGTARAATLHFSGYDWIVKSGDGLGPGPCNWREENVWVDAIGDLHLKISHTGGAWTCAEVESTRRLGFGKYQWWVIGEVDKLDTNVVFGLFNYPPPNVGPDGTNEIDIELGQFGFPDAPNLNFTEWPAKPGLPPAGKSYFVSVGAMYTTQRFTWRSNQIYFQSLKGHVNDNRPLIAKWKYLPAYPARRIPQKPLPVHMNLWLANGEPPTDGREVEVVIRSFTHLP